ncbi:MAG: nitrilase family protein [Gilvibacter sp.]
MESLRLSIVQAHLHWENPEANRAAFDFTIKKLAPDSDLIVLPEMFTTGFTMNAAPLAESMNGPTVAWMQAHATDQSIAVMGSLIIKENDNYFNRLIFAFPDGGLQWYDKRHCFTLAGEHKIFTPGKEQLVVNYKGFNLFLLVCYDLRFPVWARNTVNYDAIIYVANWPKARVAAWDALLKARAIENMAYCIGVNRVGLDGNGYEYTGHSGCYDALGYLQSIPEFEAEFTQTTTLSKKHIKETREKLKFLDDRDSFTLLE